jgi:uncharacterized membrane protein YgaE (UPF0421/DUF939 family)
MDIKNLWKKCCDATMIVWQKSCQSVKNVFSYLTTLSYTTYGITAGFVLALGVVSMMHHTKDGVGTIVEKLDSTEQKLAALEKKLGVDVDGQHAGLLTAKLTSTEQKLEALEKKIDVMHKKQEAAHVAMANEKIKYEIERQVVAQQMQKKVIKEKRKKVLRNMLDALADDDEK